MRRTFVSNLATATLLLAGGLAWAGGQYGPGVSASEIKIGNTMPYSGATSPYGAVGKSEAANWTTPTETVARAMGGGAWAEARPDGSTGSLILDPLGWKPFD
jgi:hypothetical protein